MNIDPNDPRLTAYALGELEDENERIEIEKALEHSEELRQTVEEMRETAGFLREELLKESSPGLSPQHQQRIESQLRERPTPFFSSTGVKWAMAGGLAAAACVILAIVVTPNLLQSKSSTLTLAELRPPAVGAPTPDADAVDGRLDAPRAVTTESGSLAPEDSSRQETSRLQVGDKKLDQQGREGAYGETGEIAKEPEPESQRFKLASVEKDGVAVGGDLNELQRAGGRMSQGLQNTRNVPAPSEANDLSAPVPVARSRLEAKSMAIADRRPLDIPVPTFNTEAYDRIVDNQFLEVSQNPLSTFSIDVDTASYSNLRRFLEQGSPPPRDAVRIEEMLNYFSYDYPSPSGKDPFSFHVEVAQAPWNLDHRLVHVGLKGKEIQLEERPSTNLVFLLDVSGSMQPANKLPLLKKAMRLMVDRLSENDRVAIVVYAGASGLVLPSTSCDQKETILAALENLQAGGSTNGGSGIRLAYETAVANFISGGINRVILATDGDFNVGTTNQGELTRLIEEKAKSGVFLSVLGFGMGNYKDSTLEKLADMGNGNYAYIDTINEARKVLVDEINSTLITIAKDVKIQIEFNPMQVSAYRLIGYENRLLQKEDFNDDTKDAGEIGAGHTVTALYEIVPAGTPIQVPEVDPLKYQRRIEPTEVAHSGELLTLKLRYKDPDGETSKLLHSALRDSGRAYSQASVDFKFAAAVASFGMLLRESPHKGSTTFGSVLELAEEGKGKDPHGYRTQFLELVKKARTVISSDSTPQ